MLRSASPVSGGFGLATRPPSRERDSHRLHHLSLRSSYLRGIQARHPAAVPRLIPRLSEHSLGALVWHIVPVTLVSLVFVVAAVWIWTGWLY